MITVNCDGDMKMMMMTMIVMKIVIWDMMIVLLIT